MFKNPQKNLGHIIFINAGIVFIFLFGGALDVWAEGPIVINEVMSNNDSALGDEDGNFSDWIELKNLLPSDVNLTNYTISDGSVTWTFPNVVIKANDYLLVWASSKNKFTSQLHTSFNISNGGETVVLKNTAGVVLDQAATGVMLNNQSRGRSPDGTGPFGFLDHYSPGNNNTAPIVITDSLYKGKIVINEVMTSNDSTLADEDGEYSDWVEIFNSTSEAINLTSFMIADQSESRWIFPSGTVILPKQYMVIFASGKDRQNPQSNLHTDFKLSADGDVITILDPAGKLIDQVKIGSLLKGQSLGRKTDNGVWYIFGSPTPRAVNNSIPHAPSPIFSLKGGFYNGSQTLSLSSSAPAAQINYTLFKGFNDIGEPIVETGIYSGPLALTKTTVVRAQVVESGFTPGPMVAHTYFINFDRTGMPVISLTTDRDNLFDPMTGIYVTGENPDLPNYLLNNVNDERPVHVEFFDDNGQFGFAQNAGIQIQGNSSRELLPRPLALRARSSYNAPGKFKYPLFPGKPINEFDRFALRNNSQDGARLYLNGLFLRGTFLRNGLIANLNRQMDVDFRDSRNVIVFIDGEYWGFSNLQEQFSNEYVSENYPQVASDDADLLIIRGGDLLPIHQRPDNEIQSRDYFGRGIIEYENASKDNQGLGDYLNLVTFMQSHNLNEPQNYAYVQDRLDIKSTVNYFVTQVYAGDVDWPNNNVRIWRDSSTQTNGLKGRWHYVFSDSDFTFNLIPELLDRHDTLQHAYLNSIEFKALLGNDQFRRDFLAALAAGLNGPLSPNNVLSTIEKEQAKVEGQIPNHLNKWFGGEFTVEQWRGNIDNMRQFVATRKQDMFNSALQLFQLPGMSQLTTQVSPTEAGYITVNDISLKENNSSGGMYFNNIPLQLKAKSNFGFKFKGWRVDQGALTSGDLTVIPSGNKTVTAVFEAITGSSGEVSNLVINEVMGDNTGSVTDDLGNTDSDWIELKNVGTSPIDIKDFMITDGSGVIWQFRQSYVIAAGGYLIVWATGNKNDGTQNDRHTNFKISANGEVITLKDSAENTLDTQSTASFVTNRTQGRNPDGTGNFTNLGGPTPGTKNIINFPPTVTKISDKTVAQGQSFDITVDAVDPDGDSLTYNVTSSPAAFRHFSLSNNVIHLTPDAADVGTYTLTVAVDDGKGNRVDSNFKLTVTSVISSVNIVINEAMGSNSGGVTDDLDNTNSDWIELKNIGASTVDIKNFTITDGSPAIWQFQDSHAIPAGGYLVIWATDNPQDGTQNDLHSNFKISTTGETITLKDNNGNILDSQSTGGFTLNSSRGRNPDGTGGWGVLSHSTPAGNNTAAVSNIQTINYGDVNADGQINGSDAVIVAKSAARMIILSAEQIKKADVNGDGRVKSQDASLIAQKSVGMVSKFPVQP